MSNQIVIGSSTSQLLDMITNLLNQEKFIIEKPSYPQSNMSWQKEYELFTSSC